MPIAEVLLGSIGKELLGHITNPVLKKVMDKIGAKEVIESLSTQLGVPEKDLTTIAKQDPVAFQKAVEAVAEAESSRWATLLAESSSNYWFVSGARPFMLWAVGLALLWTLTSQTLFNWILLVINYSFASEIPLIPNT